MSAERAVSVVIAVSNDRRRIGAIVHEVYEAVTRGGYRCEVIVVDEASTDQSAEVAREAGARVVALSARLGYAHAVRAGIEAAEHETIALFDQDGGFQATDLLRLLSHAHEHDMVVGTRAKAARGGPLSRRIARAVLGRLARSLAERDIPDLNSGMRVLKRRSFRRFAPLARGFALTTALTLGMLAEGFSVVWVPVATSAARPEPRRFTGPFDLVHLVVRTTLLFHPLKALGPIGYALLAGGLALGGVDLWRFAAVGGGAALLVVAGLQALAVGFLADLIVTVSRTRQ